MCDYTKLEDGTYQASLVKIKTIETDKTIYHYNIPLNDPTRKYKYLIRINSDENIVCIDDTIPGYWQLKKCNLYEIFNIDIKIINNKPIVKFIHHIKDCIYYGVIKKSIINSICGGLSISFCNSNYANNLELNIDSKINIKKLKIGSICSFTVNYDNNKFIVDSLTILESKKGIVSGLTTNKGYGYITPDKINKLNNNDWSNLSIWSHNIDNFLNLILYQKITYYTNSKNKVIKIFIDK